MRVFGLPRIGCFGLVLSFASIVSSVNFPFEADVLSDGDIGDFAAISFGNRSTASPVYDGPPCKAYPGTSAWPSEDEWSQLNTSLSGSLMKPVPIAATCYNGPYKDIDKCNILLRNAGSTRTYIDDPLTVLAAWPQGDTCYAVAQPPQGVTCAQGGFPVYVVNATSVKQIQVAVNFARNRNVRLVIKNTGHDFIGRSSGFGALSVWTHWLKDFEFLPRYTIGEYNGMAARVGAGLESWEMFSYMDRHDMTVVVAGGYTVGAYGGWLAGGGHSALASTYGLGADQVLSLQVVTADGMFVTADVDQNTEVCTYGIVTSAIVKAYPPIQVLASTLTFSVSLSSTSASTNDVETFWRAFDAYHAFGTTIVDAGGTAYSFLSRSGAGNTSFSFSTDIEMPGLTATEIQRFVQPLYDRLTSLGLRGLRNPQPLQADNWADTRHGVGDTPGSSRFGSRIFPRANFETEGTQVFNDTQGAIRRAVENGYSFHGIHMSPSTAVVRYPTVGGVESGVNPAFRSGIMHADLYESARLRGASPSDVRAAHELFSVYMDDLREVTSTEERGGGAYVNECDIEEPDWQRSFWGDKYERLLGIKSSWDPWGLFYGRNLVGSEGWAVTTADGLPTQNGPLCRVSS